MQFLSKVLDKYDKYKTVIILIMMQFSFEQIL